MAMSSSTHASSQRRGSRRLIFFVGAIVIGAAAIAIGVSSGRGSSPTGPTVTYPGGVGAAEYQPLTVDGSPLVPLGDSGSDAAIGLSAPTIRGYDFVGAPVNIVPGDSGDPVMLVFLAHWCPHCNREVPRLVQWHAEGLVPKNLRVVGITTSSRNDQPNWPPSKWIEQFDWPFEVMADSRAQEAASAYGVDGFPFMVIVDGRGKVALRMSGEREVEEIVAAVEAAIGKT